MAQLNDLPEECLLFILDRLPPKELFILLGVNKKMNRLAEEKIRTNIKSISLSQYGGICSHHYTQNGMLCLWPMVSKHRKDERKFNHQLSKSLSKDTRFLNVFTRCASVKSIEFGCYSFPDGLLLEVIRRCPQVECVNIYSFMCCFHEWSQALELVGHQLVHFIKGSSEIASSNEYLCELVASKCPNIKRLDWYASSSIVDGNSFSYYYERALKRLPKNCWVKFARDNRPEDVFEDCFDELTTGNNFNLFSLNRIERLSILKVYSSWSSLEHEFLIRGVDFVNLKKLKLYSIKSDKNRFVSCILASRFPRLEEFSFFVNIDLTEDDYDRMFQRMTSVKKLILFCNLNRLGEKEENLRLPRSAINHLEKLENIRLKLSNVPEDWPPEDFFEQLERYRGIKTMKNLTVEGKDHYFFKFINNKLKTMSLKQSKVKINFVYAYRIVKTF